MTAAQGDAGAVPALSQQLGDAMSRVARQLQEEHGDVEGTLRAITAAAVRTVPHADECGISYVVGRRKIEPRASTGDLPRMVDSLQERLGQGPCMDAVREQHAEDWLAELRSAMAAVEEVRGRGPQVGS